MTRRASGVEEGYARRRTARRIAVLAVAVLAALLAVATGRLFVWPARGVPRHADGIVLFNGKGDRIELALHLAYSRLAPNLVISRGGPDTTHDCAPPIDVVAVTCFNPTPVSTRGEAEFAGTMATQHGWESVVLVTTRPQATRARLRMSRCFSGEISVATAKLPWREWPYAVAYEWGALLKALVVERAC